MGFTTTKAKSRFVFLFSDPIIVGLIGSFFSFLRFRFLRAVSILANLRYYIIDTFALKSAVLHIPERKHYKFVTTAVTLFLATRYLVPGIILYILFGVYVFTFFAGTQPLVLFKITPLSHLRPPFACILNHYGHARQRRRASARCGEAPLWGMYRK